MHSVGSCSSKRWPLKKVGLPLIVGLVLVDGIYQLYCAWTFHQIYGRGGWIYYDTQPASFWITVGIYLFLFVVFAVVAILVTWPIRYSFPLKSKVKPPIDEAVRQSISER